MQYVPPLRVLASVGEVDGSEERITLPLEAFHAVRRAAFDGSAVDAVSYAATCPEVAATEPFPTQSRISSASDISKVGSRSGLMAQINAAGHDDGTR